MRCSDTYRAVWHAFCSNTSSRGGCSLWLADANFEDQRLFFRGRAMKRLSVTLVVLGLVVALSASLANATINLPGGRKTGHLFDASNLYYVNPAGGARLPRPIVNPPIIPAIGDENRSVVSMDSFESGGSTVWTHDTPDELTGLFYDISLAAFSVNGNCGRSRYSFGKDTSAG